MTATARCGRNSKMRVEELQTGAGRGVRDDVERRVLRDFGKLCECQWWFLTGVCGYGPTTVVNGDGVVHMHIDERTARPAHSDLVLKVTRSPPRHLPFEIEPTHGRATPTRHHVAAAVALARQRRRGRHDADGQHADTTVHPYDGGDLEARRCPGRRRYRLGRVEADAWNDSGQRQVRRCEQRIQDPEGFRRGPRRYGRRHRDGRPGGRSDGRSGMLAVRRAGCGIGRCSDKE